jgi:IclR family transcriptional regulator, KDG regulon repressor
VQLGILAGVEVLYIAKVESDRPFRLVSRVGMRLPAWATGLGKVLLAALPREELRRRMEPVTFERFTDTTVRDLEQLERVLARIRSEGVGRDHGEYTAFVYCVAAPVRDQTGDVVAAVSCTLPEAPRKGEGDKRMADVLVHHATELSKSLGWAPSDLRR